MDLLTPPAQSLRAITRFHLASGVRVASRESIVGLCLIVFAIGSAPNPLAVVRAIMLGIASAEAGAVGLHVLAALALGLTIPAARRLMVGARGWMRSLPTSAIGHRRAMLCGLIASQLPVFAVALACTLGVMVLDDTRLAPAKLVAVPLLAVAAAALPIPTTRVVAARVIALVAIIAAARGTWAGCAAALVLMTVYEFTSGRLEVPAARSRAPSGNTQTGRAGTIAVHLIWRALGWRLLLPLPASVLALAAAYFYRTNNTLALAEAAFVARLWGLIAVTLYVGLLGDALAARRTEWPWARSLPWSAKLRVAEDAVALTLPAVVLLVPVAMMNAGAAISALATLPLFGVFAASLIPSARNRLTRVSGVMLCLGFPAAWAIASWPGLTLLCLALAPFVLLDAARRRKRSAATTWRELYHDPGGDSLSWSTR